METKTATVNPAWFTYALNADPEQHPDAREYVLGMTATFTPPPDTPSDSLDVIDRDQWQTTAVLLAMSDMFFWRGFLDARATIGIYSGQVGKKIQSYPSIQLRHDSGWLKEFVDFLILHDRRRPRDSRHPRHPFKFDDAERAVLALQASRGRLNAQADLAHKILWLVYQGADGQLDQPCSPRHLDVIHDVLHTWTSRARRKLLKRGWAVNTPEGELARASKDDVVLEFEPSEVGA